MMLDEISESLKIGQSIVVATVLSHHGSAPRTAGSRMIVRPNGTISGTIGGGTVEAMVLSDCRKMMGKSFGGIREFRLDKSKKAGLDMICGGAMTVLMIPLNPDTGTAALFETAAGLTSRTEKSALVYLLHGNRARFQPEIGLVTRDRQLPDTRMALPDLVLTSAIAEDSHTETPFIFPAGLDTWIIEPICPPTVLYIFGAGHVGNILAHFAHLAGFQVVIIDDRKEFADPLRFDFPCQVRCIENFFSAFEGIQINGKSYVVILTRGHLHDQTVLEQAIATRPAYIGMIGSRTKRDTIYASLLKKGVSKNRLEQVHSPIGIDIASETPAEIAVSIMAEIIHIRRRG